MSVPQQLTTDDFWEQGIHKNIRRPTTAIEYHMMPHSNAAIRESGNVKYGKIKSVTEGSEAVPILLPPTCVACTDSICGGANELTGEPKPWQQCGAGNNLEYGCYYNTIAECNGGRHGTGRESMVASLSSVPFEHVMETAFTQPNYSQAFQTFASGYVV